MTALKDDFAGLGTEPVTPEERQLRMLAIGAFFEAHRRAAGLELEDLARVLELDVDALIGYEAGRLQIPLDDMFVLTNALNVAPEDLFAMISDVYGHLKTLPNLGL